MLIHTYKELPHISLYICPSPCFELPATIMSSDDQYFLDMVSSLLMCAKCVQILIRLYSCPPYLMM